MRRRAYLPVGNNPKYAAYHKAYDKFKYESNILTGDHNGIPSISTIFWAENTARNLKYELVGDEEGMLKSDNGYKVFAPIPHLKAEIDKVIRQFIHLNQERWNQGYETLKKMPSDLRTQKLELEAELDVELEELEKVNKYLAKIEAEKKAIDDKKVLQYGLRCAGQLHDGILVEIDGQNVGQKDNLLVIMDERSPYNGMSVIDYRKLTKEIQDKKAAADRELILQREKELKEKGFSNIKVPSYGIPTVSRESLPPWPTWAKNHLKKEKVENKAPKKRKRKTLEELTRKSRMKRTT